MAINKGKGAQYKGKSLDEIDLSDNLDPDDSDDDSDRRRKFIRRTEKAVSTEHSSKKESYEDSEASGSVIDENQNGTMNNNGNTHYLTEQSQL